jgi:glycerophosphoryl diester phosphodiesterase
MRAAIPTMHPSLELPPVIGHRGAAARAPENTLAGLRRAKQLGCSWVEFDVRLTGDGVPVLCHDAKLDRTTDGNGLVSAQCFGPIRDCDAGEWFAPDFAGERVPTLDEALTCATELDLAVNIEIKSERSRDYATAAAVATTLCRLGEWVPMVLVSSFQQPAVAAIRALAPQVPRGVLFHLVPRNWRQTAHRLGCAVIGADHRRLWPGRVAAIRDAGYPLMAFTVNDPARARLLYSWGVTSVFSDVPDIILRAGERPRPVLAPQEAIG